LISCHLLFLTREIDLFYKKFKDNIKNNKMSLKGCVKELNQLKLEINRNNAVNKKLRIRAKELEQSIKEYLQQKNQNGLKYNGQAIIVENKEKRTTKSKKEKYDSTISFLQSIGVSNPEEAYLQLEDLKKGDAIEQTTLKFKKI
tara:strand:- start:274 stop:705 length:432 start_codon:yes stop_codon:yes gene_type:complete